MVFDHSSFLAVTGSDPVFGLHNVHEALSSKHEQAVDSRVPGAIYHVMCRGNARQRIFQDDADHQRLIDGLDSTVSRFGWELFSYILMPNHFHLFVRHATAKPSTRNAVSCVGLCQLVCQEASLPRAPITRQV